MTNENQNAIYLNPAAILEFNNWGQIIENLSGSDPIQYYISPTLFYILVGEIPISEEIWQNILDFYDIDIDIRRDFRVFREKFIHFLQDLENRERFFRRAPIHPELRTEFLENETKNLYYEAVVDELKVDWPKNELLSFIVLEEWIYLNSFSFLTGIKEKMVNKMIEWGAKVIIFSRDTWERMQKKVKWLRDGYHRKLLDAEQKEYDMLMKKLKKKVGKWLIFTASGYFMPIPPVLVELGKFFAAIDPEDEIPRYDDIETLKNDMKTKANNIIINPENDLQEILAFQKKVQQKIHFKAMNS